MAFRPLQTPAPDLFKQGPSALSRLVLLIALSLFLMLADVRFKLVQPLRASIATALYPFQWLALQPVDLAQDLSAYLADLKLAQRRARLLQQELTQQHVRTGQLEHLELENSRLRQLLDLGQRLQTPAQAAQVLYDASDPFSHRVVLNKGALQHVLEGAPVMDAHGVLGQVTRVYPFTSEVSLLIERNFVIPVINTRTGARGLLYGETGAQDKMLELRYILPNADMKISDLLATSGADGVYPPGLPVARISQIDASQSSTFVRIQAQPLAQLQDIAYVMILQPVSRLLEENMQELAKPPAPATPP